MQNPNCFFEKLEQVFLNFRNLGKLFYCIFLSFHRACAKACATIKAKATRGQRHDSIAGFKIDNTSGQLTPIGHTSTQGEIPRNFAISPDGRFLYAANQNTDNVLIFSIQADGKLQYRNELKTPTPVCIQFVK